MAVITSGSTATSRLALLTSYALESQLITTSYKSYITYQPQSQLERWQQPHLYWIQPRQVVIPFKNKQYNSPAQTNKQVGQKTLLMIAIIFQQSSIMTQLSLNPKQQLSKFPKLDERPLVTIYYLMIVNNYKRILILNDKLSPEYPIVIA